MDPTTYGNHGSRKRNGQPSLAACVKNFRSADIKIARKLRRLRPDLQHLASLAPRPNARAVKVRSSADDSANVDTPPANGQPILGALLAPATFEHEPLSNARSRGNRELEVSRHMLYCHIDDQGRPPPYGEPSLRHRHGQELPHA